MPANATAGPVADLLPIDSSIRAGRVARLLTSPSSSRIIPTQKGKSMSLSEPVLTGPGAGRTVSTSSGSSTELKLDGEQAGGDWAVVEWHLRAGDEPPIHTHTREDETVYVLDGSITAYVGDGAPGAGSGQDRLFEGHAIAFLVGANIRRGT